MDSVTLAAFSDELQNIHMAKGAAAGGVIRAAFRRGRSTRSMNVHAKPIAAKVKAPPSRLTGPTGSSVPAGIFGKA